MVYNSSDMKKIENLFNGKTVDLRCDHINCTPNLNLYVVERELCELRRCI